MASYRGPEHRQPSTLLTTFSPSRSHSNLNTPLSAAGLSSPFQNNAQYYGVSGMTPVTTGPNSQSPMVTRGTYSMPSYNPGEWAAGSRQPTEREQQDVATQQEQGLNSPPPPYSPPPTSSSYHSVSSTGPPTVVPQASSPPHPSNFNNTAGSPHNFGSNTTRDAPTTVQHAIQSTRHTVLQHAPVAQHYTHSSPPGQLYTSPQEMNQVNQAVRATSMTYQTPSFAQSSTIRPPTQIRSSSAGPSGGTSSAGPSRDSSVTRISTRNAWHPGMPLPGPPPGPPPSASRSQSASAVAELSARRALTQQTTTRTIARAPNLDTIPATPANWEEAMRSPARPPADLRVNTNIGLSHHSPPLVRSPPVNNSGQPSSSSLLGLSRSSARRDSSVQGILERRAKRQSMHESDQLIMNNLTIQTNPWANAMSTVNGVGSTSRPSSRDESKQASVESADEGVGDLTPNTSSHGPGASFDPTIPAKSTTPPDTPALGSGHPRTALKLSIPLSSKALPTPPLSQKTPAEIPHGRSASIARMEDVNDEYFAADCIRRHRDFLQKERSAKGEVQKLQLFTEFVLKEAAIRRVRYAEAFASGRFDVVAARGRLFEEPKDLRKGHKVIKTPSSEIADPISALTDSSYHGIDQSGNPDSGHRRDYRPMLSPIVSMDEYSSRGRPSSRWWESDSGSPANGAPRKIKKSKRESKYMGLSAALMQASIDEQAAQNNYEDTERYINDTFTDEKANPDSFGYYTEPSPALTSGRLTKMPATPRLLDVSRFVTLPPPYPRHHPALNNSHPSLAKYRTTVRSLGDLTEVRERKTRHKVHADALKRDKDRKRADVRKAFRENIQTQIADGSITYADAAEAEEALLQGEHQAEKQDLQAGFESLQDVVIKPLHDMLNDRVVQLNKTIHDLQDQLLSDAENSDPDRPQQEGDETPELLEYLTLLKWSFETRESVYKELFDLLSDRNDQYKAIVVLPHKHIRNAEKVRSTEEFFARDTQQRRLTFCTESLNRHQTFFQTVEENVGRAVQLQSSAFWDIAPSLSELLQKIPDDVRAMEPIAIPEEELLENPRYRTHPSQYLYTLLDHSEKSTYQFIESQTNLHCLLHEAKSSLFAAKQRVHEAEKERDGPPHSGGAPNVDLESQRVREEAHLTSELKQKVSMIEEQWLEGLGSELQATRERVKAVLMEEGIWEELNEAD